MDAAPEPEARVGADGKPELWVGVEGSRLELAYASESQTEVRDGADRLLFHGAPTPGTRLVVQEGALCAAPRLCPRSARRL